MVFVLQMYKILKLQAAKVGQKLRVGGCAMVQNNTARRTFKFHRAAGLAFLSGLFPIYNPTIHLPQRSWWAGW